MARIEYRGRLLILGAVVLITLFIGVIGYIAVRLVYEPASVNRTNVELVVDGLYWTVVTLSTLGSYPQHVELISTAGEVLTILMVTMGVTIIFIAFPLAIGPWLEVRFREATKLQSAPLPPSDHVIICGYSDVGKEVISDLEIHDVDYCVVDINDAKVQELLERRIPHVQGDATKEEVLSRANLSHAIALVATSSDSTNAFICLTARKLSPSIRIVASAHNIENQKVLRRAGADKVVSPKSIAGVMLGRRALSEYDFDLFGKVALLGGLEVRQATVTSKSALIDQTLRSSELGKVTGVKVIGIWSEGEFQLNPPPNTRLIEGLILLVMGTEEQLQKLTQLL